MSFLQRKLGPLALALALLAGPALAAGGSKAPEPMERARTPEEQATAHYNSGITHRDRAWKLEEKLATATPDKRAKLEKKIRAAYENSAAELERAVNKVPRMFQAHSSLGYALRKLGNFEGALAAYDRALALNPGYGEAIEYRGQAYLGLDRIEEAKTAYLTLFANDRALAADLLAAMKRWLERSRRGSTSVDPATVEAFRAWVAEREKIAKQRAARLAPERASGSAW